MLVEIFHCFTSFLTLVFYNLAINTLTNVVLPLVLPNNCIWNKKRVLSLYSVTNAYHQLLDMQYIGENTAWEGRLQL